MIFCKAKSQFVQADVECLVLAKEIVRFLRASGYCRRSCRNFSDVAMPLTRFLCKKSKFCWNEKCEEAFQEIKMLVNGPVLRMPDYNKPFFCCMLMPANVA